MKRLTVFLSTILATVSIGAMADQGKMDFSQVDKDGDKNLSQQELQEAGKDVQVDQYDQDNDGVLSEEEFKQLKEQKKSQGDSRSQGQGESQNQGQSQQQ